MLFCTSRRSILHLGGKDIRYLIVAKTRRSELCEEFVSKFYSLYLAFAKIALDQLYLTEVGHFDFEIGEVSERRFNLFIDHAGSWSDPGSSQPCLSTCERRK